MKKIFILLASIISLNIFGQSQKGLLWEITHPKTSNKSYVFGTIHLLCEKDFEMPKTISDAVKNTEFVCFEIDLSNPEELLQMEEYKNNLTYSNYTPKELETIGRFFKPQNLELEKIKKTHPLNLYGLMLQQILDCPTTSIEQKLLTTSNEHKKTIKGLETTKEQLDILNELGDDYFKKELISSIEYSEKLKSIYNNLRKNYRNNNLDGIESALKEESNLSSEMTKKLLDQRNKKWIPQLNKLLLEKPSFIAVGTGHLVGENGLIELLRKEGYTVTPVAIH